MGGIDVTILTELIMFRIVLTPIPFILTALLTVREITPILAILTKRGFGAGWLVQKSLRQAGIGCGGLPA
jgi:hypothetical protein